MTKPSQNTMLSRRKLLTILGLNVAAASIASRASAQYTKGRDRDEEPGYTRGRDRDDEPEYNRGSDRDG